MPLHSIDMLSLACAALGTLCMVFWPIFPNRRHMLVVQLGIAAGFGAHYWLEGAQTAALLNGLGLLHVLASLFWGTSTRMKWVGYAMIPAIVIGCLATWSGLPSLFSGIGTTIIAVGRVQVSPSRLRVFVLAGTPFWLLHDLMIGSPLFFADAISIAMGAYAVVGLPRSGAGSSTRPPIAALQDLWVDRGRIDPSVSESINRQKFVRSKPSASKKSHNAGALQ